MMSKKTHSNSVPMKNPTIAVALGGGGARGYAHIHALEALDEMGIKPVAMSGSSIGALIGAGYASGMSGADMHQFALKNMGNRTEVMAGIWRMRPRSFSSAVDGGVRFGQINILSALNAFLPDNWSRNFEQLEIPLHIIVTDFYAETERVINQGDLFCAIGASAALPAIFRPVTCEGRICIDGGIMNPVPFDHLTEEADIVLAIDVVGGPIGDPTRVPGNMDSMFGASQLMMRSIIDMKLKAAKPDIFLRPPVSKYRVMDFLKVEEIMEETASFKDEVTTAVTKAISDWRANNNGENSQ